MRLTAALLAASTALAALSPAWTTLAKAADALPEMLPHRALYKLTLAGSPNGDVIGATGTMSYEMTDACEGWAVHQRLELHLTDRDGQDVEMLSDYVTFEAKDGASFRFKSRQSTDQTVTDALEGTATLRADGSGGTASYAEPEKKEIALPAGTLFPTPHTQAVISAAQSGKKTLNVPLFDGTGADGAQDSFVNVLSWEKPKDAAYPVLSPLQSGRFHISFYSRKPDASTPDYEVSMRYWQNGVADNLVMNFGDFLVNGAISEFRVNTPRC